MKRKRWLALVLILLSLLLIYWAIRSVSIENIFSTLSLLSLSQIVTLILLNVIIVLLFGLRWWLILKEQGYLIPFGQVALYRLAGFGVSYFTPGPQFGGEPLQVLLLRNLHQIPGSSALASVTLDKVIELLSNFAFLTFGLAILIRSNLIANLDLFTGQWISIIILFFPVFYFVLIALRKKPISFLVKAFLPRFFPQISATEEQLVTLVREKPRLLLLAFLASTLVWLALLTEYQLALRFLGLPLTMIELLAIVLAARLAMLAPTPGALGALEASQVIAMQSLGYDPAIGLSLIVLIRARDLLFGGFGLWIAFRNGKKT